jgi:UDP-N-acetylglucosamine 2-epimerase (non-hydrolysing)
VGVKIIHVVGARPNFMKVAPVVSALNEKSGVVQVLVHTGQHYDANMSEIFFKQLDIPRPDINLEVGSGSHAQQTAQIISGFEAVVLERSPDLVLVYGDVNSTVAAALVCSKLQIPVGHVEAGLRSFDRRMPEEINRLLTDQMADILFTPSTDGNANLLQENVNPDKIHMVGNVMIDTLVRLLPKAGNPTMPAGVDGNRRYALVTLHRPSNVDDADNLTNIMQTLEELSDDLAVVFPIHPRTRKRMADLEIKICRETLHLIEPVGYLEFLSLQRNASLVVTDSGGVQEETTFLGIPCLTVRENTERPVTVDLGTNILVGQNMHKLKSEADRILSDNQKRGQIPPLWDGRAGKRIADIII